MGNKSYRAIVKRQAAHLSHAYNYLINTLCETRQQQNSIGLHIINDVASNINNNCEGDSWTVDIKEMELPIATPRHLKPGNRKLKLKLFVSIKMICSAKSWDAKEDCIKSLNFKVNVFGIDSSNANNILHTGFHIDKVEKHDSSMEMHPLYHVHFINESKIEGIEALSMDVPRLMHHPVDVLLGLLLVFANYNQEVYNKLLNNGNFMGLCRESANHILVPYFKSLSAVSMPGDSVLKDVELLCPYMPK